jgi:hypothetical protein
MGTMIRPLSASIKQPAQNSGTRAPADHQAAYMRDRELEEAARPLCADCGVIRGFFIRRRRDTECRPASFALCNYCFDRPEPRTEQDRQDRKLAVVRAWREEMRTRQQDRAPIA